jgi:hypothetical protein
MIQWVVVGAIVLAFVVFGVVLEWAERTTNAARRPSRVRRETVPLGRLQVS